MPKTNGYISLMEATKHCDYSQEYLSLRARQGKLKAVKFGRNWVTKKEWLDEYLINNHNVKKLKLKQDSNPEFELPRIDLSEIRYFIRYSLPMFLIFCLLGTSIVFGKDIISLVPEMNLHPIKDFKDTVAFISDIEMPEIKMPEIKIEIPQIEMPEIEMQIPKIEIPQIIFPDFPEFKLPKIEKPKLVMPEISLSKIEMPEIKFPEIEQPKFRVNFTEIIGGAIVNSKNRLQDYLNDAFAQTSEDLEYGVNIFQRFTGWYKDQAMVVGKTIKGVPFKISGGISKAGGSVKEKLGDVYDFIFPSSEIVLELEPVGEVSSVENEGTEEIPSDTGNQEKETKIIVEEKEVIKEVQKITQIEPIKEVITEIKTIDDESLTDIRKQITSLQSSVSAFPSTYVNSGFFNVGNTGALSALGSSTAGFKYLDVTYDATLGTQPNDDLTINATSFFNAPIRLYDSLNVGELDSEANFTVDTSGNLTTAGDLVVSGEFTVSGAQSYLGVASFAVSSSSDGLLVNQQGTGNVASFQTDGADNLVIINGGQTTITSTSSPQLKVAYDSSNYASLAIDSQGDLILTASGGDISFGDENLTTSGSLISQGQGIFSKASILPHSFVSWSIGTANSNVADASLYINPASAVADSNLLGLAVNGGVKFLVDAEGDVFVNSLTAAGSVTVGTTTISTLIVENNAILGDAATDSVTLNGRFVSSLIPKDDNAYDLGIASTNRWRTGYFGTSVIVGGTTTLDTNSLTGSSALTVKATSGDLTLTNDTSGNIAITSLGTITETVASGSAYTLTDGSTNFLAVDTNGAIAMNPTSGQDLSLSLGTTGDFVVNTNDFFVDTSEAKVGIGTDSPTEALDVLGKTKTNWVCGDDIIFTYKGSSVTYGTVSHNSECWLDRNLGASQVATAYNDSDAYGDLFQWGRLDDQHQTRTSSKTTDLSSTDDPGHSNFIYGMGSPYDWRSPQNDNLWQGVSGTNNPCPSGWRIPTETEWETERGSWSENNRAGAYASPLKLTAAGYRYYSDASLSDVGSNGRYWSSTTSTTNARYLFFSSSDAFMNSYYRAYGFSVRCIKDDPSSYTTFAADNITSSSGLNVTALDIQFDSSGRLAETFASGSTYDLKRGTEAMLSVDANGAIAMTPTAGQDLSVSLGTTGDFVVNTNDFFIDTSEGNVGIGLAAPGRNLDILDATASTPQIRLTSDADTYGEFYVDATGDLSIGLTDGAGGDDIVILDENIKICAGGSFGSVSCPAFGIDGTGNLIIEDELYIGPDTSNYVQISGSTMAYAGTAKPKRSIILTAAGGITPSAAGAAQTKVDGTNHTYYVLDFDADSDEAVYWHWIIPDSYDGGNITVTIYWFANTIVDSDVVWAIQTVGVDEDEPYDPVSLGSTQTKTDGADNVSAANDLNSAEFTAFSPGWVGEDEIVFRVFRDADNGSDTMAGDARLVKVKIEYSVSAESD